MGTTAHVIVVAPEGDPDDDGRAWAMVDMAQARLVELEARWTRFDPRSDVSRLNALRELPLIVSPETFALVELAVEGWRLTGGRFDPTVLDAMVVAGYDRSFEHVSAGGDVPPTSPAGALEPTPGCEGISTDPIVGSVRLGAGVAFDPGGIGKGLAADLVARELLDAGARGACVNVGGDVRVVGEAPGGAGWLVEAEHPMPGHAPLSRVRLRAGAVASSWRTERTWTGPDGTSRHHLVDPATGAPAASGLAGVCVIAGPAWLAEVLAKRAFVSGLEAGRRLLDDHDASGWLVDDDGVVHAAGAPERFAA
jgi:thiamine biosynthesis lipoprotein